jgi:hypothetical protein
MSSGLLRVPRQRCLDLNIGRESRVYYYINKCNSYKHHLHTMTRVVRYPGTYLYMLHVQSNIYKVGFSTNLASRLNGYPKSYTVVTATCVDNGAGRCAERIILDSFSHRFTRRRDFGTEYFEGNKADMSMLIVSIAARFSVAESSVVVTDQDAEEDNQDAEEDNQHAEEDNQDAEEDNQDIEEDNQDAEEEDTETVPPQKKDAMHVVLDYAGPIIHDRLIVPIAEFYVALRDTCSAAGERTPSLEVVSRHVRKLFGGKIANANFVFKPAEVEKVEEVQVEEDPRALKVHEFLDKYVNFDPEKTANFKGKKYFAWITQRDLCEQFRAFYNDNANTQFRRSVKKKDGTRDAWKEVIKRVMTTRKRPLQDISTNVDGREKKQKAYNLVAFKNK